MLIENPIEEWRGIANFGGMYEVSNMGRVRSNKSKPGVIMKPSVSKEKSGYKNVHIKLCNGAFTKRFRVARLVWESFNGPIPEGFHVDHIDNNQLNNKLENLQLLSLADNNRKRWKDNPEMKSHGGVARKKVRCLETGVIYGSLNEAARILGSAGVNIARAIKDPTRTSCGFHWAWA